MRPTALTAALAILAATPLPAASFRDDGEKELAGLIKDRVAGEPTSCIPQFRNNRSWTINRIGVVYEVGTTRYVMRFQDGCDRLDQTTFFSTNTPTIQLCEGDIARVFESGQPSFLLNTCIFGKFVPYKREG